MRLKLARVMLLVGLCALVSLPVAGVADAKKKKKKKVGTEVTLTAEEEGEYGEFLGWAVSGTLTSDKKKCLNNRGIDLTQNGNRVTTGGTSDTDTGIFVIETLVDPGTYVAKVKKSTVGRTVCKATSSEPLALPAP